MIITNRAAHLEQLLTIVRKNKTIGFVPTMGALHEGHLSLVKAAKDKCDFVVVSIFVNPTQFNNPDDLRNYPRTIDMDIRLLADAGVNLLFQPSEQEIYPKPDLRQFDFGNLDSVMEGAFRPGHFNGVAQVVDRLFKLVKPVMAFFGEKDFQQLAIIRMLVEKQELPIRIMGCPIMREYDGLAMSSRNRLLSNMQRLHAPLISRTLFDAKEKSDTMGVEELKDWVRASIDDDKVLETEYVEVVDARTLQPVKEWSDSVNVQLCVAVYARPIRLIDNVRLK